MVSRRSLLSCCVPSRSGVIALLPLLVLGFVACTSDQEVSVSARSNEQTSTSRRAQQAAPGQRGSVPVGVPVSNSSLPPGPPLATDTQISTDSLIVSDPADVDALRMIVETMGGLLQPQPVVDGVYKVIFGSSRDVETILRRRDRLRAAGFDAAANPVMLQPPEG